MGIVNGSGWNVLSGTCDVICPRPLPSPLRESDFPRNNPSLLRITSLCHLISAYKNLLFCTRPQSIHWDDLGTAPNTPPSLPPTLSKLKTCTGQWLENTHIQAPTERNPWAITPPSWKPALNANLKATFVWHLHLEIPAYCRGHNLICQCWQENIRAYPQNDCTWGLLFSDAGTKGTAMHTLETVWGFPTKSPSISSLEKKGGNEPRK